MKPLETLQYVGYSDDKKARPRMISCKLHSAEQIRTDNLKAYLATGDFARLRDKPPFHTPSAAPDHVADTDG